MPILVVDFSTHDIACLVSIYV